MEFSYFILQIRDIEFIENTLFAATEGGILSLFGDEDNMITNIDGLEGVDILSIEKDHLNNLWIGVILHQGLFNITTLLTKITLFI